MLGLWYDNKHYGHCLWDTPYFEIFIPLRYRDGKRGKFK